MRSTQCQLAEHARGPDLWTIRRRGYRKCHEVMKKRAIFRSVCIDRRRMIDGDAKYSKTRLNFGQGRRELKKGPVGEKPLLVLYYIIISIFYIFI